MKKIYLILLLLATSLIAKDSIQVTGYGNTENEALKSAYQNAVEQYVGVLIDTKTVIKNSKLIQNQILTFSNGYIDSYKKISSKEQMGLWEVKIEAVIKKQDILSKIKSLKLNPIDIKDSHQRYAKLISQVNSKFDAEDLIVDLVKEVSKTNTFRNYTSLSIDSFTIDTDKATRKLVPARINFSTKLDWDEYHRITSKFEQLFKAIGGKLVSTKKVIYNKDSGSCTKGLELENLSEYRRHNKQVSMVIVYKKNDELYSNKWVFPESYRMIYPFNLNVWDRLNIDKKEIEVYDREKRNKYLISLLDSKSVTIKIEEPLIFTLSRRNGEPDNRDCENYYGSCIQDNMDIFSRYSFNDGCSSSTKIYENVSGSSILIIAPPDVEFNSEIHRYVNIELPIKYLKDLKQVKIEWQ